MINKEDMKKAQLNLFDFLENIIKKKYNKLDLECFLKFKNRTIFEKTMKRILKGKDEFECEEYKMTFETLEYIIEELQKLKKKKKPKKKPKKKDEKKDEKKPKKKPKKKSEKLSKEDCKEWEENKKNIKNGKVININNGKEIKYTKKNGDLTKKVLDINKECEKTKSVKKMLTKKLSPPLPKNLRKSPMTPKPIKSKKKLSPPLPKNLRKSPMTPKPKSKKKMINDFDEDECKTQDDCDSKCCRNNKCVSGSICKKEKKENEEFEKIQKQIEKEDKKDKKLRHSYEHFETKVIGHIKDLTSQLGRNNIKKIISKKNKLEKKMLSIYNQKFAGTSQAFIINVIPTEIQRHFDFLNQRIKFLTPEPQKSKTPTPESEDSPGTLFDKYYIKLMDSNPPTSLLDKIIRKYKIQFDFNSPPNKYQKMIGISENFKAINDSRIQKYINGSGIPDEIVNEMSTFTDKDISNLGEIEEIVEEIVEPEQKKSVSKSKPLPVTHTKILKDLNDNKLNQEDMDKILKKLNLKTQKEYLKELILIGLNKL